MEFFANSPAPERSNRQSLLFPVPAFYRAKNEAETSEHKFVLQFASGDKKLERFSIQLPLFTVTFPRCSGKVGAEKAINSIPERASALDWPEKGCEHLRLILPSHKAPKIVTFLRMRQCMFLHFTTALVAPEGPENRKLSHGTARLPALICILLLRGRPGRDRGPFWPKRGNLHNLMNFADAGGGRSQLQVRPAQSTLIAQLLSIGSANFVGAFVSGPAITNRARNFDIREFPSEFQETLSCDVT